MVSGTAVWLESMGAQSLPCRRARVGVQGRALALGLLLGVTQATGAWAAGSLSSYADQATDVVGTSGAAAAALGAPDYAFINDATSPEAGANTEVFGVGESVVLSFPVALANGDGEPDLLLSAYVGGIESSDNATVQVSVSSDGVSFTEVATFDTAEARNRTFDLQENNFAGVKHFEVEFGAADAVTHVKLSNLGGTGEGFRLDAAEGLHPSVDSKHAFEVRFERYQADGDERVKIRVKNLAGAGGVAAQGINAFFIGNQALSPVLMDTMQALRTPGEGRFLCVEGCSGAGGLASSASASFAWSEDGIAAAAPDSGLAPGRAAQHRRGDSLDIDSGVAASYLAGMQFSVRFADGYLVQFDYGDVAGFDRAGALYQKHLYDDANPSMSGPRPVQYFEFVDGPAAAVVTFSAESTAGVGSGHTHGVNGRLRPISQNFQEDNLHVEAFWVRNSDLDFIAATDDAAHFHDLQNGFEGSHGFESTPGLGPDRQGIYLQRVDGGPFDLLSLDYQAAGTLQSSRIFVTASYNPAQPIDTQATGIAVERETTVKTLVFNDLKGVTGVFIMADLVGLIDRMNFDNIRVAVPEPMDVKPMAVAGADQFVLDLDHSGSEPVTLDGSASFDSDGSIVAWRWSEGDAQIGSTAITQLALPLGIHQLTLTVTDDDGNRSSSPVEVIVGLEGGVPFAKAGPDIAVTDTDDNGYEVVHLDGSASIDVGGQIVTGLWREVGGAQLGTGSVLDVPLPVGQHDVVLEVTDDAGNVGSDHVIVRVMSTQRSAAQLIDYQTTEETTDKTTHNLGVNTLPILAGDLMIAHLCVDGGSSTTLSCPAGWTQIQAIASQGGRVAGAACYKEATEQDTTASNYTWATNIPQQSQSGVILLRGHDPLAPIEASAVQRNESDVSPLSPALVPDAAATSRVLRMMCADAGRVTEGAGFPSGMAQNLWLLESTDGGTGPVSGGVALDVEGATGAAEWTSALSEARESVNFSVAVTGAAFVPPGVAPVANAGTDVTVTDTDGNGQEAVTLDGSGSSDADGTIVSWTWSEGGVTLGSSVSPTLSFGVGTHTVTLAVVDNTGKSASDSVAVTVNAGVVPPVPPVANAGADVTVQDANGDGQELVALDGSASSDADGTIVSWNWSEGGTALGTGATLGVALGVGVHDVVLAVVDNGGNSASDHVTVTVSAVAPPPPAGLSYVGSQTTEESSDTMTHDLNVNALPIAAGDLMVAHLCADAGSGTTLSCPAGWTAIRSIRSQGGRVAGAACYKKATVDDTTATNYPWTSSNAQQSQSGVILLRGQDPLAPIVASSVMRTELDLSPESPALATGAVVTNRVLRMMCADGGNVTEGAGFPAGMAQNLWLLESADRSTGPVSGGAALDVVGAAGVAEWTNAVAEARESVNFSIAVAEDPSTPVGIAPVANAGADVTVTDTDDDGQEAVTLDGSASSDADGTIVSWTWSEGGVTLGNSATATLSFGVGIHTVTLAVVDDTGKSNSDQLTVTVNALTPPPPAGLSYVASQTTEESSDTMAHDLNVNTLPIAAGDLLIAHMCTDAGSSTTLSCPAGWTAIRSIRSQGGRVAGAACYKQATADDTTATNYPWTSSNAQQSQSGVILLRGQDPLAPIVASSVMRTELDASPESPALATGAVVTNRVLRMMCADGGNVTEGAGFPAGMAQNLWLLESADGSTGPVSGGVALDVVGAAGVAEWSGALTDARESVNFSVSVKSGN